MKTHFKSFNESSIKPLKQKWKVDLYRDHLKQSNCLNALI